ncbi:MAG: UDP-N-acetylmuramoyl-tripeptide--D-alanyl-D-alanine ligase [Flavobacteriales bacterium]|nr:UDP-N-acetylmuramoyl-tripeptide--D-alanyl-D-alanine ligase [Flavobacteriales bacterium]
MEKIEQLYQTFLSSSGVTTDTRKIEPENIFFALKGPTFNGNQFAELAFEKGAKLIVIDEIEFINIPNTFLVDDCLLALQELAKYHRKQFNFPILGLTGSNGKTTTKELIQAVLSKKFKTMATIGNLNNHIGVPLTLLSFPLDLEIGIVEMGANHQKEIEFLSDICQPNYGLITNFGKAHLEGFGGVEGVIKGKSELYNNLFDSNGTIFYNADDEKQKEILKNYANKNGFTKKNIPLCLNYEVNNQSEKVEITYLENEIKSNLFGSYNAQNIMYAVLIGNYFKVPDYEIKEAIESYFPTNNRSQWKTTLKNQLILDAYNANPSSMQFAINEFYHLKTENEKLCILGDMFELGNSSKIEHQNILSLLSNLNLKAYLVGKNFKILKEFYPNFRFFESVDELIDSKILDNLQNKTILIKGSRGIKLETIYEFL